MGSASSKEYKENSKKNTQSTKPTSIVVKREIEKQKDTKRTNSSSEKIEKTKEPQRTNSTDISPTKSEEHTKELSANGKNLSIENRKEGNSGWTAGRQISEKLKRNSKSWISLLVSKTSLEKRKENNMKRKEKEERLKKRKQLIAGEVMMKNGDFGPAEAFLLANLFLDHFDENGDVLERAKEEFEKEIEIFESHGDFYQQKAGRLVRRLSNGQILKYSKIAIGIIDA